MSIEMIWANVYFNARHITMARRVSKSIYEYNIMSISLHLYYIYWITFMHFSFLHSLSSHDPTSINKDHQEGHFLEKVKIRISKRNLRSIKVWKRMFGLTNTNITYYAWWDHDLKLWETNSRGKLWARNTLILDFILPLRSRSN